MNKKLCVVTSVFNIRKDRPIEYYLTPTIDMLTDLAGSNINICVYTDQEEKLFPKANNISIFKTQDKELDNLIKPIWGEENWRSRYQFLVSDKELPAARYDELIAIWLGKITMMKNSADMGDLILWQDGGIRMPRIFQKDINNYRKKKICASVYNIFANKFLDKSPLVFMKCDTNRRFYHGVDMLKYAKKEKPKIRGGFIFARSSELEGLLRGVKEEWSILTENGDYGTEENALTLYQWKRADSAAITYNQWLTGLCLK